MAGKIYKCSHCGKSVFSAVVKGREFVVNAKSQRAFSYARGKRSDECWKIAPTYLKHVCMGVAK